jgi:hypothetical protein
MSELSSAIVLEICRVFIFGAKVYESHSVIVWCLVAYVGLLHWWLYGYYRRDRQRPEPTDSRSVPVTPPPVQLRVNGSDGA